jgi:hypothetical protein
MDTYAHEGYKEDPLAALSPTIRFQRRLGQLQNDAVTQINQAALSRAADERDIMLVPTVEACVGELAMASVECASVLGSSFSLYESPTPRT